MGTRQEKKERITEHRRQQVAGRCVLGSLMEERLDFIRLNFDRFTLVFSELKRDPESKAQYVDQVLKPTSRGMEGYLESRMASRVFRTTGPSVVARATDRMVTGFVLPGSLEGDRSPCRDISKGELAERLATMVPGSRNVRRKG